MMLAAAVHDTHKQVTTAIQTYVNKVHRMAVGITQYCFVLQRDLVARIRYAPRLRQCSLSAGSGHAKMHSTINAYSSKDLSPVSTQVQNVANW